jgi:hypothetical protein
MDQRAKASDGVALAQSVLDHLDRTLDAKTKSVFISQ